MGVAAVCCGVDPDGGCAAATIVWPPEAKVGVTDWPEAEPGAASWGYSSWWAGRGATALARGASRTWRGACPEGRNRKSLVCTCAYG